MNTLKKVKKPSIPLLDYFKKINILINQTLSDFDGKKFNCEDFIAKYDEYISKEFFKEHSIKNKTDKFEVDIENLNIERTTKTSKEDILQRMIIAANPDFFYEVLIFGSKGFDIVYKDKNNRSIELIELKSFKPPALYKAIFELLGYFIYACYKKKEYFVEFDKIDLTVLIPSKEYFSSRIKTITQEKITELEFFLDKLLEKKVKINFKYFEEYSEGDFNTDRKNLFDYFKKQNQNIKKCSLKNIDTNDQKQYLFYDKLKYSNFKKL